MRLVIAICASVIIASGTGRPAGPPSAPTVVVLSAAVRDSINVIFQRNNAHWNELAGVNTLTQMLGTGHPTQKEYLGCLIGHSSTGGDTVYVTDWVPARDMRQLQYAVTGNCDTVASLVGTWHTHPFHADSAGRAIKGAVLSTQDLSTFAGGHDRVVLAAWDVDSVDVAVRDGRGAVEHPAAVVVR